MGEFASHRVGRGRPGQDALPRRHHYGGADDPIYVADTSNQDEVEDAKKTVEVPQMHDTNKIARRCCAEIEEGLKRHKEIRLRKCIWCSTSTESWTCQWTRSLVMLQTSDHVAQSVTVTWRHSDVEPFADIPPDGVATIAVQAQTTENLAEESLYFNSLSVERPQQVPQVMTQEVMVPVAGLPRVLRRSVRELRGADCGNDCGGAAGADH